jgi:quercetin dioxygenase-like cupin family protein
MADKSSSPSSVGLEIGATGCRITHGRAGNIKKPFSDIDLTMHELSPSNPTGFRGQLGFIEFTTDYRLPRHIHMSHDQQRLVDERILILNGVGLVELAGEIFAVAPGSLVTTVGGVPHTFTAAPAGVNLPDGRVSTGTFTMVYEYEEATAFFPTKSTEVVSDVKEYQRFEGPLEEIRFPVMTAEDVVKKAKVVFDTEICSLTLA